MARAAGRASVAMTKLVLETYGTECHLRLKGCKRVATTKDHLVPHSAGGADELENYRPACKPCNSKRQNISMTGYGASVVVVIGPPAGGKSTYVKEHARPADVAIDMDEIARALMPVQPAETHVYPDHVRHVAIKARAGAIHAATRLRERVTVWLIHAIPTPDDLEDYRRYHWQIVTVDPGREVVEARARTLRPEFMNKHIERWYATYPNASAKPKDASETPLPADPAADPDW